jgi:ATP-dependent helicase YprA (DUF1998 family)
VLKPKEEGEFIRLMALPAKEDSHWFRSPTSRSNIAYHVHWYNEAEGEEADLLARLVHETKEQYPLLRLLTDGQQQVFVATNALGLSVDRGSIRHVFFLGEIRRLRDLVQQSGRAGRDGAPSTLKQSLSEPQCTRPTASDA